MGNEWLATRLSGIDWRQTFSDYAQITFGVFLLSLAFNLFYVQNEVVPGGVSSLGVIANYLFKAPVGLIVFVLNVPIFIAGLVWAGGVATGARTLYAIVAFSFILDVTAPFLPSLTKTPLLYIAFGGALDGLGIGIVLRAQGTTGGTDILARVLYRFTGIGISEWMFVLNGGIVVLAAIVFGLEQAMYGVMIAGVSAFVTDVTLSGGQEARQALIISDKSEQIRDALLHRMERGVTVISSHGGYTDTERPILMCVVRRTEIITLRRLVYEIDPRAFVTVGLITNVWGEGFDRIDREV